MVVMGVKVHALTHRRYSPSNDLLSVRYPMKAGGIAHDNQRCKYLLNSDHRSLQAIMRLDTLAISAGSPYPSDSKSQVSLRPEWREVAPCR